MREVAGITEYARLNGISEPLYVKIRNDQTDWYILLLGVYSDRALAEAAKRDWQTAKTLRVKPWIRQLGVFKKRSAKPTVEQLIVSRFAEIPKVDDLLNRAERLIAEHGRSAVKTEVRNAIDGIRTTMLQDQDAGVPGEDDILESVKAQLQQQSESTLMPVINLTGTVLHTNLGRARLPQVAIEAIQTIGQNYSNLEYDLDQGNRGDRDVHVESLIQRITGAEAATVVNNNAAAVMITLSALAAGKEEYPYLAVSW